MLITMAACFAFGFFGSQVAFPNVAMVRPPQPLRRRSHKVVLVVAPVFTCMTRAGGRPQRALCGVICMIAAVGAELYFLMKASILEDNRRSH